MGEFTTYITKEELNSLPVQTYTGKIVVVSSPETAAKAIDELKRAPFVGFDTETKPNFKKGISNKVALLQLSTDTKCFLIRLSKIGITDEIKQYLEDENHLKIGLSIKDDFLNLAKLRPLSPKGFIDLQELVKEYEIKDISLTKINAIVFGKRISKGQQLSNWEAPSLSEKQKKYAALDAAACVHLYNELKSGNFNPKESRFYRELEEEI